MLKRLRQIVSSIKLKAQSLVPPAFAFLRALFHFHPAPFIGGGISLAFALVRLDWYGLAYASFALALLWSVGIWLTSDYLARRRELFEQRTIQRRPEELRKQKKEYRLLQAGITLLIIGAALAVSIGVVHTRKVQVWDQQLTESWEKLEISPPVDGKTEDVTTQTAKFTITNDSPHRISDHTVFCGINGLLLGGGVSFDQSLFKPHQFQMPMLGGGNGESVACFSMLRRL